MSALAACVQCEPRVLLTSWSPNLLADLKYRRRCPHLEVFGAGCVIGLVITCQQHPMRRISSYGPPRMTP